MGQSSQLRLRILLHSNLAKISATERTYSASRWGGHSLLDMAHPLHSSSLKLQLWLASRTLHKTNPARSHYLYSVVYKKRPTDRQTDRETETEKDRHEHRQEDKDVAAGIWGVQGQLGQV